jgi:hypothetical protein
VQAAARRHRDMPARVRKTDAGRHDTGDCDVRARQGRCRRRLPEPAATLMGYVNDRRRHQAGGRCSFPISR